MTDSSHYDQALADVRYDQALADVFGGVPAVTTSSGETFHASLAEIVDYLSTTTDDVYELLPGDPDDDRPMIYFFDQDSGSHVFVEWSDEHGWIITWQCSPGAPTSAKVPAPNPADPAGVAKTIAAIRSGEIDEFEGLAG